MTRKEQQKVEYSRLISKRIVGRFRATSMDPNNCLARRYVSGMPKLKYADIGVNAHETKVEV